MDHKKKLCFLLREIKILRNLSHSKILKLKYIILKANPKTVLDVFLVTELYPVDL